VEFGSSSSGADGTAVDGHRVHAEQLAAAGMTAFDSAEAEPVPTAFVAATLNVYAVPLVNPDTVTLVSGGLPVTVVGVCAVDPINGVTV
jgi:hypothetical protein